MYKNRVQTGGRCFLFMGLLILASLSGRGFAADAGTIMGTVQDKSTGEALPSANIVVKGTTWGAVSDLQGRYPSSEFPSAALCCA